MSQRTHKCQSKPPGTVVRQTGNLVEKLKKKHIDSDTTSTDNPSIQHTSKTPPFPEVSEANAELVLTGAKISLEDMEAENFLLLAETFDYNNRSSANTPDNNNTSQRSNANLDDPKHIDVIDSNLEELIDSIPSVDKNIPSPSEILKNLCLSKEEDYTGMLPERTDNKQYDIIYNEFGGLM